MEFEALKWEFRRKVVIRHRLSSITQGDARSEALRIALLLWQMLVLNLGSDYDCWRSTKVIAPRLRNALVKARADHLSWNNHTDILAWILTVGAMALEGEADQDWFIQQVEILIGYEGIKSEAEFYSVLKRSLYLHKVQCRGLKKNY
jgi:hypothetical protein